MAEVRFNGPLYKVTMTEYERGYGQREMGEKFFDNEEERSDEENTLQRSEFYKHEQDLKNLPKIPASFFDKEHSTAKDLPEIQVQPA